MENISILEALNKDGIGKLKTSLKNILCAMGVHVKDVFITEKRIYDGRLLVEVKTTDFQTVPTMFKSVCVEGEGFIKEDKENSKILRLPLSLFFMFDCWDGGRNGVDLGLCRFTIYKKDKDVFCEGLNIVR